MKDLSDSLVEEILTEVANGFLGERKKVEEQIRVFESCVSQLNLKRRQVLKKAALLNYLLLSRRHVETFYRRIGVDKHPFVAVEGQLEKGVFLPEIPFVIRKINKYIQMVISVYRMLVTGVNDYLYGSDKPDDDPVNDREQIPDVNFRMIMIMADLINENIKKLAHGKSPSSVLQYARSFNPEMMQKEKITGAVSPDYKSRLDEKLAFKRIEPDRLPIERLPEIPDMSRVRKNIINYCKDIYPFNKSEIRSRLSRLENILSPGKP